MIPAACVMFDAGDFTETNQSWIAHLVLVVL